jgi:hypothetical protein
MFWRITTQSLELILTKLLDNIFGGEREILFNIYILPALVVWMQAISKT